MADLAPVSVRPPSTKPNLHARARKDLWQRNKNRWGQWRQECASGQTLVERARDGRARPYELGALRYALRQVATAHAIAVLEWLLAGERGFAGKRGVVMKHRQLAQLLAISSTIRSERRAADAMRELCALGLVKQRPHFRVRTVDERAPRGSYGVQRGVSKRLELTPAYQTTARCAALLARRDEFMVGQNRQPGKTQRVLRTRIKRVPARRPEQLFVAEVLASRKPVRVRPFATVIERRPDGSVALGPSLSLATLPQRLRREGPTTKRGDTLEDAISGAWAAFERQCGEQPA